MNAEAVRLYMRQFFFGSVLFHVLLISKVGSLCFKVFKTEPNHPTKLFQNVPRVKALILPSDNNHWKA